MKILIGMTTADRRPQRNYVGATLADLWRSSPNLRADHVHVFATGPDVRWLRTEIEMYGRSVEESCVLHAPKRRLTRNENGQVLMASMPRCGWVLHLEDDLRFCSDFVGGVVRWLKKNADTQHQLFSFCTVKGSSPPSAEAWETPRSAYGAMAMAIRWTDAQAFAQWAKKRLGSWRAGMAAPWRVSGFDIMLRAWARSRVLASNPSFVQHVGDESLTHAFRHRRVTRSLIFAGTDWKYSEG